MCIRVSFLDIYWVVLVFLVLHGQVSLAQQAVAGDSGRVEAVQSAGAVVLAPNNAALAQTGQRLQRLLHQPAVRRALVPATLLTCAILTTKKVDLLETDEMLRAEVQKYARIHTSIDDHLRYVPAYASIGLSLIGVKGKHSTLNQTLLYTLTYTINNTITSHMKRITQVRRPNGKTFDSFPSQHTSAAFSAATLLHEEYGERSIWYSVAGYGVAATTGGLRIAKDNHWLSDVLAGAGVGIVSTELAYWIYPWLQRHLTKVLGDHAIVVPSYLSGAAGVTMVVVL